jgi:hypothetical protein
MATLIIRQIKWVIFGGHSSIQFTSHGLANTENKRVSELVECLPRKSEALSSIPSTTKRTDKQESMWYILESRLPLGFKYQESK